MRVLMWNASSLRDPNSNIRVWFVEGMEAAGHQVIPVDVSALGALFGARVMQQTVLAYARAYRVDVALIFPGCFVESWCLAALKELGVTLVSFRYDDILWFTPGVDRPNPEELRFLQQFDRQCHLAVTPLTQAPACFEAAGLEAPAYVKWPCPWQVLTPSDAPKRPVIAYTGSPKLRPGSPETWRVTAIRALLQAGLPVEVYGEAWAAIPGLEGIVRRADSPGQAGDGTAGTHAPLDLVDFYRVIGTSQINLSLLADWLPVPNPGIRGMPIEIACSGSMALSNASAELADLFRFGEEMAVFDTLDEMVAQARHYLARPEACLEMGRKARLAAQRNGGWDTWWETIAALLEAKGHRLALVGEPARPDPTWTGPLQMAATGLAHAFEAQGRHAMAAAYFREVLQYDPTDHAAHAGLGRVGDAGERLAHWRSAALSTSFTACLGHPPVFGMLGAGRESVGSYQLEAAVNWYGTAMAQGDHAAAAEAALQVAPVSPDNAVTMAVQMLQAGHRQESLRVLQAVTTAWPHHAAAHRELGGLLFDLGRYLEADRAYDRADHLAAIQRLPKHKVL